MLSVGIVLFVSISSQTGEPVISGLAAARFGPVTAAVAGGIGPISVVLVVTRIWPEIGKLKTLSPQATLQEVV
jgi:hypothetical protein